MGVFLVKPTRALRTVGHIIIVLLLLHFLQETDCLFCTSFQSLPSTVPSQSQVFSLISFLLLTATVADWCSMGRVKTQ